MKRMVPGLLALLIWACQTKKSVITQEHVMGASFVGMLPCNDCEGIQQVITLDSNNSFRLSQTYRGNERCVEQCGRWSVQDGKLLLFSDTNTIAQYAFAGNGLVYLNQQQQAFAGAGGMGTLSRKKRVISKKINPNYLEGLDIVGFGSAPSWSLDIQHNKAIQFRLPDMDAPMAFSPVVPIKKGDTLVYDINSAVAQLQITLMPGFCIDPQGENLYDYQVIIRFRGNTYRGCGAIMNADGSLTGDWQLQPARSSGWKEQPYLIIDWERQQFRGNTGCNNVTGSVRLRGDKICFSDINFSTDRSCEGYDEQWYVDALIKCNGYTINEGVLTLLQDGNDQISFKRRVTGHL